LGNTESKKKILEALKELIKATEKGEALQKLDELLYGQFAIIGNQAAEIKKLTEESKEIKHVLFERVIALNCPTCSVRFDKIKMQQQITDLQSENAKLKEALGNYLNCVDAANAEGLQEAIANTQDEKLKDLLTRRVFYNSVDIAEQALKETE
jgi:hypothetical protein